MTLLHMQFHDESQKKGRTDTREEHENMPSDSPISALDSFCHLSPPYYQGSAPDVHAIILNSLLD